MAGRPKRRKALEKARHKGAVASAAVASAAKRAAKAAKRYAANRYADVIDLTSDPEMMATLVALGGAEAASVGTATPVTAAALAVQTARYAKRKAARKAAVRKNRGTVPRGVAAHGDGWTKHVLSGRTSWEHDKYNTDIVQTSGGYRHEDTVYGTLKAAKGAAMASIAATQRYHAAHPVRRALHDVGVWKINPPGRADVERYRAICKLVDEGATPGERKAARAAKKRYESRYGAEDSIVSDKATAEARWARMSREMHARKSVEDDPGDCCGYPRRNPAKGKSLGRAKAVAAAKSAGARAFAGGMMRVPASDPAVSALFTKYPGNAVAILDAWLAAWDTKNLAADVPGWTRAENDAIRKARKNKGPGRARAMPVRVPGAAAKVNPLVRGWSKASIAKNIRQEMHAGRPQPQAIAIAFSVAERAFKKQHPGKALPTHLRPKGAKPQGKPKAN